MASSSLSTILRFVSYIAWSKTEHICKYSYNTHLKETALNSYCKGTRLKNRVGGGGWGGDGIFLD